MKYTSKNYGKGFRRCKKFDLYIEKWKDHFRLYKRPYDGINKIIMALS